MRALNPTIPGQHLTGRHKRIINVSAPTLPKTASEDCQTVVRSDKGRSCPQRRTSESFRGKMFRGDSCFENESIVLSDDEKSPEQLRFAKFRKKFTENRVRPRVTSFECSKQIGLFNFLLSLGAFRFDYSEFIIPVTIVIFDSYERLNSTLYRNFLSVDGTF